MKYIFSRLSLLILIGGYSLISSSCNSNRVNKEGISQIVEHASISKPSSQIDSTVVWLNIDFLHSLKENTSICDCWRNHEYSLLHIDTAAKELFLKSNLLHYGHDSDFVLTITENKGVFYSDSLSDFATVASKQIEFISNDILVLTEQGRSFKFIKKHIVGVENLKKYNYSTLSDLFYEYSSWVLLKYRMDNSISTNPELINLDSLSKLILNGKVKAHCSDDFYMDGITIRDDSIRHFRLKFIEDVVIMYEEKNPSRHQIINYDTLAKQQLKIYNSKSLIDN